MGRRILAVLLVVAVGVVGLPLSPWVPPALLPGAEAAEETSIATVQRTWAITDPDGHPAFSGWFMDLSEDGSTVLFADPDNTNESHVWRRDQGPDGGVVSSLPIAHGGAVLSLNGRYVAWVDSQGVLWRRDLATNTDELVASGVGMVYAISRSGEWVGYALEPDPYFGPDSIVEHAGTGQSWILTGRPVAISDSGTQVLYTNPETLCQPQSRNYAYSMTVLPVFFTPVDVSVVSSFPTSWGSVGDCGTNRVEVREMFASADLSQVVWNWVGTPPFVWSRALEGSFDVPVGLVGSMSPSSRFIGYYDGTALSHAFFDRVKNEHSPVTYTPFATSMWGQYVAATFPGSDDLVLIDTGPKDEVVPAPPVVPPTDPEQLLDVLRALLGGWNPAWGPCPCHMRSEGEPIDIQSGNNFASWTDLEVPGRGGGLALERTYNSLDASRDGPLGYGWSANLKPTLVHDTNAQTVTVKHGNGSEVVFGEVGGAPDSWAPAPLFDATLVHDAGGTWTYEVRNQETLLFDASGGLVWEEDRNGNRISVSHPDASTEVWADEAGRTLTLAYVGGRIHTVTDSAVPPRQVRYEYDGAGDLVDVFDVEGGNWHYTYDGSHRLRTRRSPRQSAKPVGEQKVIENWYDAEGRSYREVDEEGHETVLSWEVAGDVTTATVTETRGGVEHQSRYRYEYGFLVEETHGLGSSDEATTAYRSDPDTGGMTWIRDPRGNVTTQDFDERGNLRYRRDPLGREWYWEYNEFNSPTVVVVPDGHATTNTYDVSGNLTRTDTEYRADVVGTPVARTISTVLHRDDPGHPDDVTAMTDGENKTWTYGYDQYGYRTRVTSPVGATSTSAFDNVGRRLWSRAPEGNEAGDEGDPVEQERWTTHYVTNGFGDVTEVTDPEDNLTVTGYDENRNVTSVTDAKEETTTYVYDDADRLTEEHRPDAEETVLKTEYWEDGLLKAQIDGVGARTEYFYDALGRLSRVEDPLDRETSYPLCQTRGCRSVVIDK